ncbi:translation initiation factor eIF 4e-like domain-containing protein [Myxozyma melibiosi]|uniref:Translation initiation factor eIF 4e-like domain-containing protein n=1 Tax=Myxozyma melibiosi TaxID=54550 RepID=A0ABR1FBE4_9ASCO
MADTAPATEPTEVVNEKPTLETPVDEVKPVAADEAAAETAETAEEEKEEVDENRIATVFDDAAHFTVKHPLRHKWTLWYTKPSQGGKTDWGDLLKEVVTFDSVEEFWGVYNNIPKASELPLKSDYHLFKSGVRPEWEDPQNSKGGKWAYQYRDKKNVNIDDLWLNSLLGAIGETLEEDGDDEVMGCVATIRKAHYRISVWTRSADNQKVLVGIGRRFKEILKLPHSEQVEFASHADAASNGSSRVKSRYTA